MKFFILLVASAFLFSTVCSAAMKQCGPNEFYTNCGTACEPSCQDPNPQICTLQCILDACQCKRGFVRGPSGCIRLNECPPVYGK